jgi:hypothetical protein
VAQNDTNSDKTSGYKLFRKVEWRGFGYRSDLISGDYMRRWVIKTPWFLLRLHHIMRGDSDRHFHDHPFDFSSFILKGGYVEHTPHKLPRIFRPGSVNTKRAEELHYLKLLDGPTWTVLVTSPYYRDRGFATEEGWVKADQYDAWLACRDAKDDFCCVQGAKK